MVDQYNMSDLKKHSVRITLEAREDLKGFTMYFGHRNLREDFQKRFEAALDLLSTFPEARQQHPTRQGIHRVNLKQFPIHLVYRIRHDAVVIVAVQHDRAGKPNWIDRISNTSQSNPEID